MSTKKVIKLLIMLLIFLVCTFSYSELYTPQKDHEDFLINQQIIDSVSELQRLIPKYLLAYQDIMKLARRIQYVSGVTNEDVAFIYSFLIFKYCSKYNLDPSLVASVIHTESKFKQNAIGGTNKGLMQINSRVWKIRDYFDAEENIKTGSRILYMYRNSNPKNFLRMYAGVKDNIEKGEEYEERIKENYRKFSANFAFHRSKSKQQNKNFN